jgi:hypothetical protein
MPAQEQLPWSDSNQYNDDQSCMHCGGILLHETWCPAENANVQYAYQSVLQPNLLRLGDLLILHALGVAWTEKQQLYLEKFLPESVSNEVGRTRSLV